MPTRDEVKGQCGGVKRQTKRRKGNKEGQAGGVKRSIVEEGRGVGVQE